jgi:SAM-dependent methyltransferase
MTFANKDQAQHWASVAPTWVEVEEDLEEISGLPGQLAMDRLALRPGQAVLDLGCGTGLTTIGLAARVAPGGRAVGVDIAEAMLVRARWHAAGAGQDNVEFVHADVQVGEFGPRFDAAYSHFGVMFYADPAAAFASIHRALRPSGSLAFVCWQSVTDNDWMLVPRLAAASVVSSLPPAPGPDEPGPFSLADPDRIRTILHSAGFTHIDIRPHNDFIVTAEGRVPHIAALATRTGAVRELLKDADETLRARVRTAIEDAWRARLDNGEVRSSRGVLVVTAQT